MANRAKELAMKEAIIDMKIAVLDLDKSLRKLSLSLHSFERELYGKRRDDKSEVHKRIHASAEGRTTKASSEKNRSKLSSPIQFSKVVDGDRSVNE